MEAYYLLPSAIFRTGNGNELILLYDTMDMIDQYLLFTNTIPMNIAINFLYRYFVNALEWFNPVIGSLMFTFPTVVNFFDDFWIIYISGLRY